MRDTGFLKDTSENTLSRKTLFRNKVVPGTSTGGWSEYDFTQKDIKLISGRNTMFFGFRANGGLIDTKVTINGVEKQFDKNILNPNGTDDPGYYGAIKLPPAIQSVKFEFQRPNGSSNREIEDFFIISQELPFNTPFEVNLGNVGALRRVGMFGDLFFAKNKFMHLTVISSSAGGREFNIRAVKEDHLGNIYETIPISPSHRSLDIGNGMWAHHFHSQAPLDGGYTLLYEITSGSAMGSNLHIDFVNRTELVVVADEVIESPGTEFVKEFNIPRGAIGADILVRRTSDPYSYPEGDHPYDDMTLWVQERQSYTDGSNEVWRFYKDKDYYGKAPEHHVFLKIHPNAIINREITSGTDYYPVIYPDAGNFKQESLPFSFWNVQDTVNRIRITIQNEEMPDMGANSFRVRLKIRWHYE